MPDHEHDVDAHEHESWGRADKSDKPDRADRPDRVDRPDKSDKSQGRNQPDKGARVARLDPDVIKRDQQIDHQAERAKDEIDHTPGASKAAKEYAKEQVDAFAEIDKSEPPRPTPKKP